MSILTRIKSGLPHLHDHPVTQKHTSSVAMSALGFAVEKAERYGAAYGFGYIKGRYRERAMIGGYPVDVVAGAGLTLLSAGLQIASKGSSKLAPHLEAIGDSGVTSYFNSLGAAAGARAGGRTTYVQKYGAPPLKVVPPGLEIPPDAVGAIPPAAAGAYLTPDELANPSAPVGNE